MNYRNPLFTVVCLALSGAPPTFAQTTSDAPDKRASAASAKVVTASERLAACEKKYAEAKTYREEGTVVIEFKVPKTEQDITDKKPFRMAFERGKRLFWEFRGSTMPGQKPDQTYSVWSSDQESFKSFWTLTKATGSFKDLMMALAAPTGVSGGSALATLPLLRPDALGAYKITNLTKPIDKGSETIDGHECTKIEGNDLQGVVTIWIDKDFAVRKFHRVTEVDSSKLPEGAGKDVGKFTFKTTMTFKPVFDEKIEDDRFSPPAGAK